MKLSKKCNYCNHIIYDSTFYIKTPVYIRILGFKIKIKTIKIHKDCLATYRNGGRL